MTIPARVFCDASFFYACLDPQDRNHPRAVLLVTESAASGTVLHTTWDVISETATLLRYRRHFQAARAFLLEIKPMLRIVSYGDGVREEAQQIFLTYGRDHRLSFCDAVTFVVVTTLLDHVPCFAFDEDFRSLGLQMIGNR